MSDLPKRSTHAEEANPIKSDGELQLLVKKLDKIKKYNGFQRWKSQFLDRLDDFLYDKGMEPAEKSCIDLDLNLKKLVGKTTKVLDFIHKGDLGSDKKTVKASLALNEMCNSLENVRMEIETLIPSLKSEEKRKGFSKFHLGAALIRQNFHQYLSMKAIEDAVTEIGEKLEDVADRQQHELFIYYKKQVSRFCDVMADLNLYTIMLKCIEFMNAPEEEESEEPDYFHISVQEEETGNKLPMEVESKDTVESIREAISIGFGIPLSKQILKYKGSVVDEDLNNMEALGVKDGDVFLVLQLKINITVNAPAGKQINLVMDPGKFLSDLKRQLETESGIPGKNQNLKLKDTELDDPNKRLEDYGMCEGSYILDLEPKTIKVNVQMPDNSTFPLEISLKDETPAIKERISEIGDLEESRQVLLHNGEEMPATGVSCKEMGLEEGSTIKVDIKKVPITVITPDGKIQMMVDPCSYVSDLKRQLQVETGIPAKNQNLTKDGNELSDPSRSLESYEVEAGTVLQLEPKSITLTVNMPDGQSFEIEVDAREETLAIKEKISGKSGMAAPRHVLKHKGEELPAEGVTSKEMGLKEGSVIDVEVFKIPITVNAPEGKTIDLMVDPTINIADLKLQLEKLSGIPSKNQMLVHKGSELDDPNKTLEDSGIAAATVLDLEPKEIKVNVKMPDGDLVEIGISPRDETSTIKDRIAAKTGMAVPRQVVKYEGEELPTEGSSATDMGIRDGAELEVGVYKIPVIVNNWDGKQIELEIEPTESLNAIKKMLEPQSGIPSGNQVLSQGGEVLTGDDLSADDLGIQAGSVLDLEPKSVNVKVQTPEGEVHDIIVALDDTVDDIKKKIEDKTGIAVPRQVVKKDGDEVTQGQTVKELGLKDGSELDVSIFKIPITVNSWDGKKIDLEVEPTDTLAGIKKMLEPESGILADNQILSNESGDELPDDDKTAEDCGITAGAVLSLEPRNIAVKVRTPDDEVHYIDVRPKDTADDMKRKIEEKTGIQVPRQVVKNDGEEIPTDRTAKEMGLSDGSELTVDIFKIPITVNSWDGKSIELEVEPSDTLSAIKSMLEPESEIPASNQVLSREGMVLNDDSKSADEHGINANDVLDLAPSSIKVNVEMPDGDVRDVEISPMDDGDAIKKKIESETGLELPRQLLSFAGEEIPDKGVTAKDLGIKDGSTIKASLRKIPVTVNCWDGNEIEIMVEPTQSLASIKSQLEPESGIEAANQKLALAGNELLDDSKTAQDHGIKAGTCLDLEPKLIKVNVTMPDGIQHQISISPSDDGNAIKKMIENQTGMETPRQVLRFNGKEIPSGSTAREVGLREGSNIDVEIFKVPVTVKTWDGNLINIMVDPLDKLVVIKQLLEPESNIHVSNQILSMGDKELTDDNKRANAYGIVEGSVLYLEPRIIQVNVEMPDGSACKLDVSAESSGDDIKMKLADATGIAAIRQVLHFSKKKILADNTVRGLGIKDGSVIQCTLFKIPITVIETKKDGNAIELMVEPVDTIASIKSMLEPLSGIAPTKQVLTLLEKELIVGNHTATECGIKKESVLHLEPKDDPIVFLDAKYGTLFGVDRDEVIEQGILIPNQGNRLEFNEAEKSSFGKERLLKAMLDSPNLGIKPQVVVEKIEVEDYDLEEAENVKSKWGVKLKKTQKNKRGDELIFVDIKTGGFGLVDRQKATDTNFISVVGQGKEASLKQTEQNTRIYDKYVAGVRGIFGVKANK